MAHNNGTAVVTQNGNLTPSNKRSLPEASVNISKEAQPSKRVKTSTTATLDGTDSSNTNESRSDVDDPFPLAGTFDLYGMDLPFLKSKYLIPGSNDVDPEALYHEILTFQADDDNTAQITIPSDYASPQSAFGASGTFTSTVFCEPMDDEPFDVCISDIVVREDIKFNSPYPKPKTGVWRGHGIKGNMEIDSGGCGADSSSGSIKMRPMWRKKESDGKIMELFEGTFTFQVKFGSMFKRGHGSGIKHTIAFWGVRGVENQSEE